MARYGIILVCAWIAYYPCLNVGFLWDDYYTIETKSSLRQWSAAHVKHDLTHGVFDDPRGVDFYRPLLTLTSRVNYSISGLRPFGYHLVNLLFHAANALLVSRLTLAIGFSPFAAMGAGCFFAVHPVIVQNLMMVSGRDELMSVGFSLITILAFLRPGAGALLLGTAGYGLALLAKESSIVAPLVAGLFLWYRRDPPKSYRRLLVLAIPAGIYFWLYQHALRLPSLPLGPQAQVRFFAQAFPQTVFHYTGLLLWPWPLYTDRLLDPIGRFWFVPTIAIGAGVAWMAFRRKRLGILCAGWFLIHLLPKTWMMMQQSLMLDHWAYPGLWALLLPLCLGLEKLWNHPQPLRRRLCRSLCMAALVSLATLAHTNVLLRGSNEKLYRWSLRFPTTPTMKSNLAMLLFKENRFAEAIPYLRSIHQENPDDANTARALAIAYWQSANHPAAQDLLNDLPKPSP